MSAAASSYTTYTPPLACKRIIKIKIEARGQGGEDTKTKGHVFLTPALTNLLQKV